MGGGSGGGDSEPIDHNIKLDIQTQRISSVKMGYLLVMLAVVLVPVVAEGLPLSLTINNIASFSKIAENMTSPEVETISQLPSPQWPY